MIQPVFGAGQNPEFESEAQNARIKIREILSRSEFRHSKEFVLDFEMKERKTDSWISKKLGSFLEWLGKLFKRRSRTRSPSIGGGSWLSFFALAGRVLLYAAIALLVCVIAYIIYRLVAEKKESPAHEKMGIRAVSVGADVNALDISDNEWLKRADDLARAGNLREAVRAVYLSVLVRLHRSRLINYEQEKTNWEYVYSIPERMSLRDVFRKLTGIFDIIWYGQHEPRKDEYSDFSGLARRAVNIADEKNRV
jgi:hypothetical protein